MGIRRGWKWNEVDRRSLRGGWGKEVSPARGAERV